MTSMMLEAINTFGRILVSPIAGLFRYHPWGALLFWSLITGAVITIVFRFTSNQQAIGRAADRSWAQLLAINLFKDEVGVVLKSLLRLFKYSFLRVAHSLPSFLIVLVPLGLLLIQLATWFEARPLVFSEETVVEVHVARDAWNAAESAELVLPTGWVIKAGPMRDLGNRSVLWRIATPAPGPDAGETGMDRIAVRLGNREVERTVAQADSPSTLLKTDFRRAGNSLVDLLLHPGEPGLREADGVTAFDIHYPQREMTLGGWEIPWWLTFFVVSLLAAFAIKPFVGVRF